MMDKPIFGEDPYFNPEIRNLKERKVRNYNNSMFVNDGDRDAYVALFLNSVSLKKEDLSDEDEENLFGAENEDGTVTPYVSKTINKHASKNCKRCNGRGTTGWLCHPKFKEKIPILCKCLIKKQEKT